MSQRFHPYSQKQKQTVVESKSTKKQLNNENQFKTKSIKKNNLNHYDMQSYVDEASARTSKSIVLYPTLQQPIKIPETKIKGFLADKTNLQASITNNTDNLTYLSREKAKVTAKKTEPCDRMLTCNIETLRFLTPKLKQNAMQKLINRQQIEAGYKFIIYGIHFLFLLIIQFKMISFKHTILNRLAQLLTV